MTPIIDLAGGLNAELTGRDNIMLFGALLGRSAAEMRKRVVPIAEWAGVADYLSEPIRIYSSGMLARLAFSVVSDVRPDVLLLDEVLAVGDADFQARSLERIDHLVHGGAAVILVSHDLEAIRHRASRALWLDHGRTVAVGDAEDVVKHYAEAAAGSPAVPVTVAPDVSA